MTIAQMESIPVRALVLVLWRFVALPFRDNNTIHDSLFVVLVLAVQSELCLSMHK